jgi:hypothetical protein
VLEGLAAVPGERRAPAGWPESAARHVSGQDVRLAGLDLGQVEHAASMGQRSASIPYFRMSR